MTSTPYERWLRARHAAERRPLPMVPASVWPAIMVGLAFLVMLAVVAVLIAT